MIYGDDSPSFQKPLQERWFWTNPLPNFLRIGYYWSKKMPLESSETFLNL